jgi:hypothetical protein
MKIYKCALTALAIVLPAMVTRGDDALIKPQFGVSATFGRPPGGRYFAARIPIAFDKDGVGQKEIDIATMHVASAKGSDPTWAQCIKSGFVRPEGSTLAILILDTCSALPPATYEMNVAITAPKKEQRLLFQVTRPAAEIRPLSTQTVERINSLFDVKTQPGALTVLETTGRTPLTNVSALRVDDVTLDGHPIGGDITFDTSKDVNGIVRLPLHLTGHFPYGKAKATVALRAAELTGPTYVAYEIQNRLHWWLLLPVIFAGLLLGYLTRTTLKRFLEGRKARIAALDLLDKMEREGRRYKDQEFAAAVGPLIANIQTALRGAAADLATTVNDTSTKFTAAFNTLQQKITDTNRAIESASQTLPQVLDFPTGINNAIAEAAAAFPAAHDAANGGDPTSATATLRKVMEALTHDVREAAATWRSDVQNAAATTLKNALPPNVNAPFTTAIATLNAQLVQIPGADVATTLSAVTQARFTIRHDIVQGVFAPLARYAQKTIDDIKQSGASAAGSEAALAKLREAIQNDVETTLQAEMEAIDPLLTALANEKAAAPAGQPIPLTSIAPAEATAAESEMATLLPEPEPSFIRRFFSTPAMRQHDPIAVDRKRTFAEILAGELASFVIAAIGITIAGALFLLPTFDGTPRGLLTALFWGYAGDISVDALTEAAKKYRS